MTVINNKPLDSGSRQQYDTGAVRDNHEGKGRYDLLPYEAKRRWAVWTENGARKYEDRNWEKGIPLMRFLDAADRHLSKLIAGFTDEDHAAATIWNVGGYIQTLKWIEDGILPASLDDRPVRKPAFNTKGAETHRTSGTVEVKLPTGFVLSNKESVSFDLRGIDTERPEAVVSSGDQESDVTSKDAMLYMTKGRVVGGTTESRIRWVSNFIKGYLGDGSYSGVDVVRALKEYGFEYHEINAGRDRAGVRVEKGYPPLWTLKEKS